MKNQPTPNIRIFGRVLGGEQRVIENATISIYKVERPAPVQQASTPRGSTPPVPCKRPQGPPDYITYSHTAESGPGRPAGGFEIKVPDACYIVCCDALGEELDQCRWVEPECGEAELCFDFSERVKNICFVRYRVGRDCKVQPCEFPEAGDRMIYEIQFNKADVRLQDVDLDVSGGATVTPIPPINSKEEWPSWEVIHPEPGLATSRARLTLPNSAFGNKLAPYLDQSSTSRVGAREIHNIGGQIAVQHLQSRTEANKTFALWTAIRNRTKAISFSGSGYKTFIDRVLCQEVQGCPAGEPGELELFARQRREYGGQLYGIGAYELLKTATDIFLFLECGVVINETGACQAPGDFILDLQYESKVWGQAVDTRKLKDQLTAYLGGVMGSGRLPYIDKVVSAAFPGQIVGNAFCDNVLSGRVDGPCLLELLWCYWHEEGMLVQTINAVSRRFQNIKAPGMRDPLAHLEIAPLVPLNNILWGYVEDERNRLSVKRRAYEYAHHYGLNLYGKAVPDLRPADIRSKFLEAFHSLLRQAAEYYRVKQDVTVVPDGYPLLNAIKEVHLILAQGAHNQFGDLPKQARAQMLIQEWIMARPEMRDFLQSRAMVPYKEEWMPQVDTMKNLQGWTDVTVTHFRDLGVYGEQIVLSLRWHNWNDINDEDEAKGWADNWRPEIQGYLHAYRAATGVDLANADTVDYTMPSVHLRKRLAMQQQAR